MQRVLAQVVNGVYHNSNATQAQVNAANTWLNQAINGLAKPQPIDTSWHKSAPAFLKGTWRSDWYYNTVNGGSYGDYDPDQAYIQTTLYIGNDSTDGSNIVGSQPGHITDYGAGWGINGNLKTRYLGNNWYELLSYSPNGDGTYSSADSFDYKVKLINGGKAILYGDQVFHLISHSVN